MIMKTLGTMIILMMLSQQESAPIWIRIILAAPSLLTAAISMPLAVMHLQVSEAAMLTVGQQLPLTVALSQLGAA